MVRQDSHLTHRPSVRTRRSSGGGVCSIDFLSRLNQAMEKVFSYKFSAKKKNEMADVIRLWRPIVASIQALIVDAPLSQYTLGVGVFHLTHLGDQVGKLDELGMSVAAGADDVDTLGAIFQGFDDFVWIE